MTELHIALPAQAIYSTSLVELQAWCSNYERHTKYKCTVLERFGIAFYQVGQALAWPAGGNNHGSVNHYEAWAACILNLLMVAERCEIPVERAVQADLLVFCKAQDWQERLLLHFAQAQRMLWYRELSLRAANVKRASRFDKQALTHSISQVVIECASLCGPNLPQAIYDASSVLTGKL